jgi:plastocyanin
MKNRFFRPLAVALCAFSCAVSHLVAASFTVDISGFAFVPQTQNIGVGDSVTWVNNDVVPHTATSGGPSPNGLWDSGFLSMGEMFSHTFNQAGTFPYYCTVHPEMTASVVVQAQNVPPAVSIASPANNSAIAAPGSVTIEAQASATAATIVKVEIFDNGASLGAVAAQPYNLTVNLTTGTHSLTAVATDSNGLSTTSPAVVITVGGGGTKIDDPIPQKIAMG